MGKDLNEVTSKNLSIMDYQKDYPTNKSKISNLDNTYPYLRKNKVAIDHYKRTLQTFSAIGDRSGIPSSNDNLGNAYLIWAISKKLSTITKKI